MPWSRFLQRFRTAVTPPGTAAPLVTPPIDVAGRLRTEIAPIVPRVRSAMDEARAIVNAARSDADTSIRTATQRASTSMEETRRAAPAVRRRALEATVEDLSTGHEALEREARREIERIGRAAHEAAPRLAAVTVGCVRRLTEEAGP